MPLCIISKVRERSHWLDISCATCRMQYHVRDMHGQILVNQTEAIKRVHTGATVTCQFKCCMWTPRQHVSSATFQVVNKSGREDNSVIPFINLVKLREMEEHQNSICVISGLRVTCSPRDQRFLNVD